MTEIERLTDKNQRLRTERDLLRDVVWAARAKADQNGDWSFENDCRKALEDTKP